MPPAYPVDLAGSWCFTELPHREVVRKGGSKVAVFLSGVALGAFALAVVLLVTITVKTRDSR
jgi:hypothetical protein